MASDRDGPAIAALALVSFGALLPFFDLERLAATCTDDAYYYFEIARRVAGGGGASFDGLHPTNGFHPAWMLALAPLFAWLDGDVAPLRAALLLQSGLAAAAGVLLFGALRPAFGRLPAAAAVLLALGLPAAGPCLRSGMEGALFFLAAVVVLRAWQRASSSGAGRREAAWLGLALAGCLLSRLESGVLAPVLAAALWRRGRRNVAVLAVLPALVALVAWMAWSEARVGTPAPVSAMVKASWAARWPWPARLGWLLEAPWFGQGLVDRVLGAAGGGPGWPWLRPALIAGLALATGLVLWRERRRLAGALAAAHAGPWLAGLAVVAFLDRAGVARVFPWYLVPWLLATGVVGGALVVGRPRLARVGLAATGFAMLLRIPHEALLARRPEARPATHRIRVARWIDANLPAGARVGSWNAGALGYFSRHPVVNLDGLVNDGEFARGVGDGRPIAVYLEREGIDWLADSACALEPARGWLAWGGSPEAAASFVPVHGSFNRLDPSGCPGIVVWRRR